MVADLYAKDLGQLYPLYQVQKIFTIVVAGFILGVSKATNLNTITNL